MASADPDGVVGGELVRRHGKVGGGRALADAARRVVGRAVARAEPAFVGPTVVAALGAERDTAQMRADADDDEPLWLLHPLAVRLAVGEAAEVDLLRGVDLLGRAVAHEDG